MARARHGHSEPHFRNRAAEPISLEGILHLKPIQLATILKRNPSNDDSSTSNTCTKDDKSQQCGKPSDSNNITLPVVLGILIPLGAALVVFFLLHRRHVRRLRREDANDPHKSLDFGIDPSMKSAGTKKGKKNEPETTVIDLSAEKALRREHGMSMDMGSPYLLPPGLQSSRESLHSLSRTIHNGDDRYRPATTLISNDSISVHSYPQKQGSADDASSYADSGFSSRGHGNDSMKQNLLQNAQRMSKSIPLNHNGPLASMSHAPETYASEAAPQRSNGPVVPKGSQSALSPAATFDTRDSIISNAGVDLRKSNNYLGPLINGSEVSTEIHPQESHQISPASSAAPFQPMVNRKTPPPAVNITSNSSRPPRLQSLNASKEARYHDRFVDVPSEFEDSTRTAPLSPKDTSHARQNDSVRQRNQQTVSPTSEHAVGGMGVPALGYDVRRLSMGFRPLPPDDPTDNPEQRANRIRSFYKEYFDDSKPAPTRTAGDYVEDYDETYLGDGAIFDPVNGQFVVAQPQFSEPYPRRAMTPPPRAPPRFQGPRPHQPTPSGGSFVPRGQRAFSSASGRFGPSGRGPQRPALPPPAPLRILPSPHLVKEDSFALPIDFAPPMSYKDRQAGRPASPRGGIRPYSPMLPAHLPLASSFDDLSVMPSPHSLRKSGTFTALDFAPPPRFKSSDTASDAGSIRSNRSAMSAQQLHSIRAGAYRVSRIPKEVVGTKNELNDSLKPQWGMRAQ